MTQRRVLLVATVQSHIAQFHKPLIRVLQEMDIEVDVAARDNLQTKDNLAIEGASRVFDVPFARSPLHPDNIKAYAKIRSILRGSHYDAIHCNTPVGGAVGRLAASRHRRRGTKVLYTAHGFHFYQGAPLRSWLIYFPIEWISALSTDTLITITDEDYSLARRVFPVSVKNINGVGGDSRRLPSAPPVWGQGIRSELGIPASAFVAISIGEMNRNKNQRLTIQAIHDLAKLGYRTHLILAGTGPLELTLRRMVNELGIDDLVHFVGYRRDIGVLFGGADLLVSASLREGLPMNVIEAMMSNVPVVASDNRGHRELVSNGKSGFLFNPTSVAGLRERLVEVQDQPETLKQFAAQARADSKPYTAEHVESQLKIIYHQILNADY